jgi:lysophospholipase L1-like esterase
VTDPVEPAGGGRPRCVLVIADSLAFHGPARAELLTHPDLYPNVLASALSAPGRPVRVEVVARLGWTARDAWEALTRDPRVYSLLLPRADAVVLAVGGMDYLPAILPTHLREGIRYLRPDWLRRAARAGFRAAQPYGARLARGRWRTLPQRLTDDYLSRCVTGIRTFRPGVPVLGILPPPHDAPAYGRVVAGHHRAVEAARRWGAREQVPMLDLPALVGPYLAAGQLNPDGMHWPWDCHRAVGKALAAAVDNLSGHPA